jgi:5'-methylthioadenosine phosphorylase
VLSAVRATGAVTHDGGTYVCIEGPTFSTKAESHLFRSWGASVVGMTNLPEARLAREAGMSYATLALATDYDCWHEGHDAVSVEAVVAVIKKNVATARAAIANLAKALAQPSAPRVSPWRDVLKGAVMTAPDRVPAEARARLAAIWSE